MNEIEILELFKDKGLIEDLQKILKDQSLAESIFIDIQLSTIVNIIKYISKLDNFSQTDRNISEEDRVLFTGANKLLFIGYVNNIKSLLLFRKIQIIKE